MKHTIITVVVIHFCCYLPVLARSVDTRWGKISDDEWKLTRCSYDTAANAVLLLDLGRIYFNSGVAVIERHRRIKILDEKGLEYLLIKFGKGQFVTLERHFFTRW